MPTKRLPSSPSIEHLKHQAKDRRAGELHAWQRIREFYPRFKGMADMANLQLEPTRLTVRAMMSLWRAAQLDR